MRTAVAVLTRFRAELAGEPAFRAIVDAAHRTSDYRMPLADWACRTVTSLALEAANVPADAIALRDAPPLTLATMGDWEHRLRTLAERMKREPEVAAYERGDYRALITVLDVDDCALAFATRAVAIALDLPVTDHAARLVRQLVGPAVVDYDYWRDRSVSLPAGVDDPEVTEHCDRAAHRYQRFFAAEPRVRASLAELFRRVMDIALYPPMLPTRPCVFCLSLQNDSVFADFDVDLDGRVFVVRISFDGYGCCHAPNDVGRMSAQDSEALLAMVQRGSVDETAEQVLRAYFQQNRDALWSDALADHDLL